MFTEQQIRCNLHVEEKRTFSVLRDIFRDGRKEKPVAAPWKMIITLQEWKIRKEKRGREREREKEKRKVRAVENSNSRVSLFLPGFRVLLL